MSQGSIDRDGAFIDVTVPVEFAQRLLDRISDPKCGFSYDPQNSFVDQAAGTYHLRIILNVVMRRARCYEFIRAVGQELGISIIDNTNKPKTED